MNSIKTNLRLHFGTNMEGDDILEVHEYCFTEDGRPIGRTTLIGVMKHFNGAWREVTDRAESFVEYSPMGLAERMRRRFYLERLLESNKILVEDVTVKRAPLLAMLQEAKSELENYTAALKSDLPPVHSEIVKYMEEIKEPNVL